MKKHSGWLIPLAGIVALNALVAVLFSTVPNSAMGDTPKALILLCVLLCWPVASIILLIRAVSRAHRVFRSHRRSRGHFTKSEQAEEDLRRRYADSWSAARALTAGLTSGHHPPPREVWGIVLEPGESVRLDITADYARFYGLNGTYVHTSGFFWGSPAFVLAGVGVNALANSARRRSAEAASRQQWRDVQHTQMFLTERRIICQANGRWLSFYYSQVSACYPEPENNSLVLEFHSAEPLLIGGAQAPLAIAYTVWALYGERGLNGHPGMRSLRS